MHQTSFLFTLLTLFFCQLSYGQTFNNSYTIQEQINDYHHNTNNIFIDPDGSTVTVSTFYEDNTYNNNGVHILKVNDSGNLIWSRRYGLSGFDERVNSICQTDDGGYIITGRKYEPDAGEGLWIFKVDNVGNLLWSKWFGDSNFTPFEGILLTRTFEGQETYMIIGSGTVGSILENRLCIIKIDDLGNTIWSNQYYDPSLTNATYSFPTSMIQDVNQNGYIIVGIESGHTVTGSLISLFSFGIDIDGNVSRQFITYDLDHNYHPSITRGLDDNGYAVSFASSVNTQSDIINGFMKLDEDLELEWTNLYPQSLPSQYRVLPRSLHTDPHGSYNMGLIYGEVTGYNLAANPAFFKIDASGNPISFKRYNLSQFQILHSMALDFTALHENYVLKTHHIANNIYSIGLIRTQLNGDSNCTQNAPTVNITPVNPNLSYHSYEMFYHDVEEKNAKTKEFVDNPNIITCSNLNLTEENDQLNSFNMDTSVDIPVSTLPIIDEKSLTIYPTLITKDRTNLRVEYNDISESQTTIRIYTILGKLISETHFESYKGLNNFNIEDIPLPQGMNTISIYKNGILVASEKLLRL